MGKGRSQRVDRIRAKIDHPIIDGDGHFIEYYPVVRDFLVEEAGEDVALRLDAMMDGSRAIRALPHDQYRAAGAYRYTWWGIPSANTLDRATAISPNLMYARMDEIGIDYAIMYPSGGLGLMNVADPELRLAGTRAYNRYYAEVFGAHRDRMEPVAMVPMYDPDEAIAGLDHAVGELGLKAVVMAGLTLRPIPGAEDVPGAKWVDTLAHDSMHDYDPVWARCEELGVAPTFHHPGMGWGSRLSRENYTYNQLGHFAAAGEATCRSLFLGGVTARFPKLRFAFLEGGVAWGAALYASLLGVYEKRNIEAIEHLNPARLDRPRLVELLREHGPDAIRERLDRLDEGMMLLSDPDDPPGSRDDFAASGTEGPADIEEVFTRRFFFGCEADDPMNALAFARDINPRRAELQAIFASDIGHWDVPDFGEVLPEAWELVEDGALDERQFRAFAFENAARLMSANRPDFLSGTVVEDAASPDSRQRVEPRKWAKQPRRGCPGTGPDVPLEAYLSVRTLSGVRKRGPILPIRRALVDIHANVSGTLIHDRLLRMRLCRPKRQSASWFTPVGYHGANGVGRSIGSYSAYPPRGRPSG